MTSRRRQSTFAILADAVSAALFFAAFVLFIAGVFFRYVLNQPITWSEELISILFVWMLFWTLGLSIRLKRQISFGLVYEVMPPKVKRIAALVSIAIGATLFILALPGTFDFLQWVARERTAALGVSRALAYASFTLFMVSIPVRLLGWGFRLVRPGWEEHL